MTKQAQPRGGGLSRLDREEMSAVNMVRPDRLDV
jgi:hypothetical protein